MESTINTLSSMVSLVVGLYFLKFLATCLGFFTRVFSTHPFLVGFPISKLVFEGVFLSEINTLPFPLTLPLSYLSKVIILSFLSKGPIHYFPLNLHLLSLALFTYYKQCFRTKEIGNSLK